MSLFLSTYQKFNSHGRDIQQFHCKSSFSTKKEKRFCLFLLTNFSSFVNSIVLSYLAGSTIFFILHSLFSLFSCITIHNVIHSSFSFLSLFLHHHTQCWGCPRGVMVKVMNCGIVVREFVLQSRYYVHFRANTLGKGMNPLILPPAMGK